MIPSILIWTNKLGKEKYSRWRDVTKGDFLRYIGLWMTMVTCGKLENRRDYFDKEWVGVVPGPKLSRFMSFTRFSQITQCLSFADMTVDGTASDPWYPIRMFVNKQNENRARLIIIGKLLCIDETMWKWSGLGLPHQSFVPRKPEPLGVESKTVTDVDTGILLYIELQEGKYRMEAMEYTEDWQVRFKYSSCALITLNRIQPVMSSLSYCPP